MKRCPLSGEPVVYLDCQECDDKVCTRDVDNSVDNVDNCEEAPQCFNTLLWDILKEHWRHHVSIALYGDENNPASVVLECKDCNEIVLDAEIYTLCAREDE